MFTSNFQGCVIGTVLTYGYSSTNKADLGYILLVWFNLYLNMDKLLDPL